MVAAAFAADQYRERGWSVIPVSGGSKLPLVPWKAFMSRGASRDEIREWGARFGARVGIAVVTGAVSRLVVLDCDGEAGVAEAQSLGVPVTPTVRTPRGGRHHYFELPEGIEAPRSSSKQGASKALDIRGHAGYVIAPHTVRPDGKRYEWLVGPGVKPAKPPIWFQAMWQPNRVRCVVHGGTQNKHERHISHDSGDGDGLGFFIDRLPLNIQRYVREGHDLSVFPSRSECDAVVVLEMLVIGGDDGIIEEIFDSYPIGDKYSEPTSGQRYLHRTIELARQRVKEVTVKYADLTVYGESRDAFPPGARLHLALTDGNRLIRTGLTVPDEHRPMQQRWTKLFEALDTAPPTNIQEARSVCRTIIGKKLRLKVVGHEGYEFYRVDHGC